MASEVARGAGLSPGVAGRRLAFAEVADYRVLDVTYAGGQALPRHTHQRPALSFVSRGSFREVTHRSVTDCTAGMIHVRPSEEPHANQFDPVATRVLIVDLPVDAPLGDRRLRRLLGRAALVRDGVVTMLARQLQWELHHRDEASDLAVEGLVLALLARLVRATSGAADPRHDASRSAAKVDRAREFIDANFARALPLADVAAVAGLHASSLARAFKRRYEITPWQYQRARQIEWVKGELERGDRPIAALAHEAGFADHSHLTRAFRAMEGVVPSVLRRGRPRADGERS